MAARNLLGRTHLPAFRAWLVGRGWAEQAPKGAFEEARFTHPEHRTLILFARAHALQHLSVQDKDHRLVRAFLRDHHDARRSTPTP